MMLICLICSSSEHKARACPDAVAAVEAASDIPQMEIRRYASPPAPCVYASSLPNLSVVRAEPELHHVSVISSSSSEPAYDGEDDCSDSVESYDYGQDEY